MADLTGADLVARTLLFIYDSCVSEGPALEKAPGSDEAHRIKVVLDPSAYRSTGQVSMAI
jgi:hypothetical protein